MELMLTIFHDFESGCCILLATNLMTIIIVRQKSERFMAPPSNPEANPAGCNNNTESRI